jgi:hypothetical protein
VLISWDLIENKRHRTILQKAKAPVAFTPDGRQFLVGSGLSLVTFDSRTFEELDRRAWKAETVLFSPGGRHVLLSARDENVELREWPSLKRVETYPVRGPVAFAPDGRDFFCLTGGVLRKLALPNSP